MTNKKTPAGMTLSILTMAVTILAIGITSSVSQIHTTTPTQPTKEPTTITAPAITPEKSIPIDISIDDDAMQGEKDAKVTIVEFSDYECPYCAVFYQNTFPQIKKEYIDTGKANFVYRDFPLSFHANSKTASMATECAREQGGDTMYFKYHDQLYENQDLFGIDNFKKWAKDLGLKTAQFDKCLDDKKYEKEVDKDAADGESYGVSGTPAFFINGRKLTGAQPISAFKTIIDEELKK